MNTKRDTASVKIDFKEKYMYVETELHIYRFAILMLTIYEHNEYTEYFNWIFNI